MHTGSKMQCFFKSAPSMIWFVLLIIIIMILYYHGEARLQGSLRKPIISEPTLMEEGIGLGPPHIKSCHNHPSRKASSLELLIHEFKHWQPNMFSPEMKTIKLITTFLCLWIFMNSNRNYRQNIYIYIYPFCSINKNHTEYLIKIKYISFLVRPMHMEFFPLEPC